MKHRTVTNKGGFSLVELIFTILISVIVVLAVGLILVDSQKGWSRMYDRIFSDVITDSYAARRTFSSVVRKASLKASILNSDNDLLVLFFYNDLVSVDPDRYAKFYESGGKLYVDYGDLEAGTWNLISPATSTVTLADNVDDARFEVSGVSCRMFLKLDNNKEEMTVVYSSVRHNDGN